MKTIFLIGGAGFIGSYISKELIQLGHRVIIYDAFLNFIFPLDSNFEFFLKARLKDIKDKAIIIRGDCRIYKSLYRAMHTYQPDIVINLAALAIAKESTKYPAEATSININGTLNSLECIRDVKSVKRYIFASSSFVYGNFKEEPANEEHPLDPIDVYGATKVTGEILTKNYSKELGIEYVIIRPSAVYGFGDANKRVSQILIENALKGKPLILHDEGKARIDFTYVTDVAHGFVLAALNPEAKNQIFNITRGEARSIKEFAEIVKRYCPNVKIINKPVDMKRPKRGTLDISKARKILGYTPKVDIETGIKKYIEDLKNSGVFS